MTQPLYISLHSIFLLNISEDYHRIKAFILGNTKVNISNCTTFLLIFFFLNEQLRFAEDFYFNIELPISC